MTTNKLLIGLVLLGAADERASANNGTFVVVGWNGCILTSSDGKSWISHPGLDGRLQRIVFDNGVFALTDSQGMRRVSRDGTTWTLSRPLADSSESLQSSGLNRSEKE